MDARAPLWRCESIRRKLALLDGRRQAVRAFAYRCAWLDSQAIDCLREISQSKALAGDLAIDVACACQQRFGGVGYIRQTAIERLPRSPILDSPHGHAP